jgi:hypothetical protein
MAAAVAKTTRTGCVLIAMIFSAWASLAQAEVIVDKGILYLDLTSSNEFRWEDPSGTTLDQQAILERRCQVTWGENPPPLVNLSTTSGVSPGFVDYLGVYGGGNGNSARGTPCGQVGIGQNLGMALTGKLDGYHVHHSEIDLQLKGSPEVTIVTTLEGATTGTYRVRAGNAIVAGVGRKALTAGSTADPVPALGAETFPAVINCVNITDSGPDSGDRDNCRIEFNVLWDEMTFTTTGGEVSIGGGGDGGFTTPTEFHLQQVFDGELLCGDTTITAIDGATGAFGQLRRLENAPEGVCSSTCVSIPYTLNWQGNELQFFADYLENTDAPQTCAAFAFTVNFAPLDIAGDRPVDSSGNPVAVLSSGTFTDTVTGNISLELVQQFEESDPLYYLDTCLGTPTYDGFGDLYSLQPPAGKSFPDLSALIGTQYGCWLNIRLRYGVDATPDDPPVSDGVGAEDELRFEVDGYLQGDWRLRY